MTYNPAHTTFAHINRGTGTVRVPIPTDAPRVRMILHGTWRSTAQ